MRKNAVLFFLICIGFVCPSFAAFNCDLIKDLTIVDKVNKNLYYHPPVYYNHLLMSGYLNMPSALIAPEGVVNVGFSHVPPYYNINLGFGLFERIEAAFNYRIFKGIPDAMLTEFGFGDKSDKGANIKVALLFPEESNFVLPGFAVGLEDFIGTKSFEAEYVVATYVLPKLDFEISLGYGQKRIRGWFGGMHYTPFRHCQNPFIKDFALVAEYDAVPYKSRTKEPHPDGRNSKSKVNFGLKWRYYDMYDFSASWVRGEEFAFSIAAFYNFGFTQGILPKTEDSLPYRGPLNVNPVGALRDRDKLYKELLRPFAKQGLDIDQVWVTHDCRRNKILRIHIFNTMYREEMDVRARLSDLLAYVIPSDVKSVVVVVNAEGFPAHEYHFETQYLRDYRDAKICPYELSVISPLCDIREDEGGHNIFRLPKSYFDWEIFPKTSTFFGSSRGKLKYALGVNAGARGSLLYDWYYSVLVGYFFVSDLYDVKDVDKLNPSQIINVRTDSVNYLKQKGITVDMAFLQRNINFRRGFFGKIALGHFEQAYGGGAVELLYYPANSAWAAGIEGAFLRKRNYSGIGFADKVRRLENFQPDYEKFRGLQYFFNFYYDLAIMSLDINIKAGQFLAKDKGVRTEVSHYFPSGLRLSFWYTYTDGKDRINGKRYHDKGAAISLPLDIFYTYSSRLRWGYGLSAWLRDVGAIAATGDSLYPIIRSEREHERK